MKSKSQDLHESTYGAVTYRNELDAMLTVLRDRGFTVTLSDREHVYANLEEVESQAGRRPKRLDVEGRASDDSFEHVTIYFEGNRVGVVASRHDRAYAVARMLFDMIRKHRSPLYIVATHPITGPIAWIVCLSSFAFKGLPTPVGVAMASTPMVAMCADLLGRRHRCLRLVRREHSNFWSRKRDEIILAAVSAILGAFLTLIVQKLFVK